MVFSLKEEVEAVKMETLLPVIVGGLIGLVGGFVGPWFLQKAKEGSEKKKHRAEKFGELLPLFTSMTFGLIR